MTIRTFADVRRLREQGDLSTAEETLIETCRAGVPTVLGEDVPDGPSDARSVRADLLRYLIRAILPTGCPSPAALSRITALAWGLDCVWRILNGERGAEDLCVPNA